MITITRKGNPGYSLRGGGGRVLLGDLGAADLVVPQGQVPVPVSDVVRHSPVNAGPESQLGRDAVAPDDLVVTSLLAPRVAVLLVGLLGQPWGVPVPVVAEPGLVVSGQSDVLDDLRALKEEPVLTVLVDPADPHLVGDNPLKESKY